jgi:hypothetical protein
VLRVLGLFFAASPSSKAAAASKRYTMDVFQGAFPGDVADARIIKNGDITFALMSNLLHIHGKLNPDENVAAMKQKLIETYAALGPDRVNRVCNVWMQSGPQMQRLAQDVMSGKSGIEIAVKSSVYTLTPFDMWILASEYEVPVILFSQSQQPQPQPEQQQQQQLVSRFFCNGCSNGADARSTNARILYSDGKEDTRHHVIVCTQPMNSFPVYGIVQYSTPDNARAPPVARYSIEQNDLKFAQPVVSLYAKNETVFDFIDKGTAAAKPVAAAAANPVVVSTTLQEARPAAAVDIMKSLPLIEMKKTGALPRDVAELGGDGSDAEIHNPEIRRLLTRGKEQLESSIHRLESPGIDPGVQANAAQAKDRLDHLNI